MNRDLTRPDRGEAMERLVTTVAALPEEDRTPYLLLVCGYLAGSAPDVLTFLLDRADEVTSS